MVSQLVEVSEEHPPYGVTVPVHNWVPDGNEQPGTSAQMPSGTILHDEMSTHTSFVGSQ